jgi:hypothetical protein
LVGVEVLFGVLGATIALSTPTDLYRMYSAITFAAVQHR